MTRSPKVNIDTFESGGAVSFNIEVDIPNGFLNVAEFEKKLPRTLKNIAKEGKAFWESEAGQQLKTSRVKYRNGINITTVEEDNHTIVMSYQPFNAFIHQGSGRFDMKPGFMASGKVRTKLKLPKHVAAMLPRNKSSGPRQFLIVPMRYPKKNAMGILTKFRTVTDKSPADTWWWKPKKQESEEGRDILGTVVDKLADEIIPKHIIALIEEVWRK